jgi:hypothetical protein
VDGGDVKTFPRLAKENPKKEKSRRVASRTWAKPPRSATDSRTEKSLEDGRTFPAPMIKPKGRGRT